MKRTSNHSEQRLFREEVLSFTSHIYMTLAILCRRRHKVAIIAELNLKFSSRFLRHRDACGMEISVKKVLLKRAETSYNRSYLKREQKM